MAWTEVRRSDRLKGWGVFIGRAMMKKREGWKTKAVLGCDSTIILISTEITRKRSQCFPCLNKLSLRTGSTGHPQLSHLTPEHKQSANGTVVKI